MALSRAKEGLVVIGNYNTLVQDVTWKPILQDLKQRNLVKNVDKIEQIEYPQTQDDWTKKSDARLLNDINPKKQEKEKKKDLKAQRLDKAVQELTESKLRQERNVESQGQFGRTTGTSTSFRE